MSYLKFKKGNDEKIANEKWKHRLLNEGWKLEGENDEREALLEQAKELGLNPHPKIGEEKLKKMIEEAGQ
jgi:hypothetical protein